MPSLRPLAWFTSAKKPAQNGATALVPPATTVCPPTTIRYPLDGAAAVRIRRQGHAGLVIGHWKYRADSAAGAAGAIVPHRLDVNGVLADCNRGAAATDDIGACGREIDMHSPVAQTVGRQVVAGGDGDGDADRPGILQRGVKRVASLRRPSRFRSAPANLHERWIVSHVHRRRRHGIGKTGVGVRREINCDARARRDGAALTRWLRPPEGAAGVRIDCDLPPLPRIMGCAAEVTYVFVNLLINASAPRPRLVGAFPDRFQRGFDVAGPQRLAFEGEPDRPRRPDNPARAAADAERAGDLEAMSEP